MRILITGAEGQLGHALGEMEDGNEWLFTDRAELDITDERAVQALLERERPDVVVNCAAFTDVDRAEREREAAFLVNCTAPRILAEVSEARGTALVHVSTDFVFGGNGHGGFTERSRPYIEEDQPTPLNIYGESKLEGEKAVLSSGVRGAVIRTSWLYSPWGRNFVLSILVAAAARNEIRVVADQVGCPTSAASLAEAIARIIPLLARDPKPAELYHFCDTGAVSRADFAAEIVRQAGLRCRVVPIMSAEYPVAATRPAYSALDTSKITRTFGIAPRPWQEPLAECINIIKDER